MSDKVDHVLFLASGGSASSIAAEVLRHLKTRILAFASLPLASIDRMALRSKLWQIGTMEGSTNANGKVA